MQYNHITQQQQQDNPPQAQSTSFSGLNNALNVLPYHHQPLSPTPTPHQFVLTPTPNGNLKRKPDSLSHNQQAKRRKDPPGGGGEDSEFDGQGAKHWTDDEKTKLFTWLMGPGNDEHYQSLRSTKNSCLRECANEVFGGKKTYQALKGCFERNFNTFKQVYAFETHDPNSNAPGVEGWADADRLKAYERRLTAARRDGADVGNITARMVDHWHRTGWYRLFHSRWHGDPQTTAKSQPRAFTVDQEDNNPGNEHEVEHESFLGGVEEAPMYVNPQSLSNKPSSSSHSSMPSSTPSSMPPSTFYPPQPSSSSLATPQLSPASSTTLHSTHPSSSSSSLPVPQEPAASTSKSTGSPVTLSIPPPLLNAYLQYLHQQNTMAQQKLDFLRRRDEREEAESLHRRELERSRALREQEHAEAAARKQNTDRAIEILKDPMMDGGVKASAAEYLKRMFEDKR